MWGEVAIEFMKVRRVVQKIPPPPRKLKSKIVGGV